MPTFQFEVVETVTVTKRYTVDALDEAGAVARAEVGDTIREDVVKTNGVLSREVIGPYAGPDLADDVDDKRREKADAEFEGYDFAPYTVDETSGWNFESGSGPTEWTRPVFLQNPDDPDGNSITANFCVRFASDSDEITEVYASIAGNDFGARMEPSAPIPGMG